MNGRGSSCLYLKERILAVLMSSLWRWISIYLWGIYVQTTYPMISLLDVQLFREHYLVTDFFLSILNSDQ